MLNIIENILFEYMHKNLESQIIEDEILKD